MIIMFLWKLYELFKYNNTFQWFTEFTTMKEAQEN